MKKTARCLSKILICTMIATNVMAIPYIYLPLKVYAEGENISLAINSNQPIDVVLTLGDTSVNATNFKEDLTKNLISKGVKPDKINISAVETNQANLQSSFNWIQNIHSNVGRISFTNNGSTIQMYGNDRNAGFNKIYTVQDDEESIKEQEISFSYNLSFGDSFDGAGILLNTNVKNNLMNGYAVFIGKDNTIKLYELTNWTNTGNEDMRTSSNARLIGNVPMGTSGSYTLKTTKDKLIVLSGNSVRGTLNLPTHYGWGFGFFSDHYSHACDDIGKFALNNLNLKTTRAKQFTEVIRMPSWTENSSRFLVDLDDKLVKEFDSPVSLGEILSRLSNSEIKFVGLGTSTNKSQLESLINRNDGEGKFILNNPYNKAIDELGDYIVSKIKREKDSEYVLVGEPLDIVVTPSNLANNTANSQYPQGRWKIKHDYKFYNNNTGQASWSGQWMNNLIKAFDKPGKYEVSFENDKYPKPRYIYAHRRPIASYKLGINKKGQSFEITTEDMSYDPDLQHSNTDKGIKEYEWKWKETTDTNWNKGPVPNSLPLGKNYLVQLRVKDYQNTWSLPVVKYITTESVTAQPVADFDLSPNPVSMYTNLSINDSSYDPAGRAIISKTWTIYNSNKSVVSSSSSAPLNFKSYGAGNYTVGLKVKNDAGIWSEEFKIPVKVTNDTNAPEAIVTPIDRDWGIDNASINVAYSDEGGSGFNSQRYAITQSPTPPSDSSSLWGAWSSKLNQDVIVTTEGRNYVHLQAKDNAGNLMKRTLGEYQIDRTNPIITANRTTTNWVKGGVPINVTATDSGSGVKKIKLPNGNFVNGTTTSFIASSNGNYTFTAEDNLGHTSSTTVSVDNVDNTVPELKFTQNPKIWVNNSVTITATATDNQSGIKRIKTPDGVWVNGATANYTVQGNGTYNFVVEDNVGNQTSKTYTIENIDKISPNVPTINMDNINSNTWITSTPTIDASDNGDEGGSGVNRIEYRIVDLSDNTQKQDWTDYISNISQVTLDGKLRIDFRVVDNAGNISNVVSKVIMRDTHGPQLKITPDTTNLTNKTVNLAIEAIDTLSGFKRLKLPDGNWVTTSKTNFVVSENGEYTFVSEDNLGNINTVKYLVRNIKKNPLITNNPEILLKLKSLDYLSGTASMQFKNENLIWSQYEPYKDTKNWRLSDGDGLKHVWVRYKDNATNESEDIEDIIILDTTDSVIDKYVLNDGKYYTNTTSIPINVHATDNLTGVKNLLVSNDNVNWEIIPYTEKFKWTLSSGDGEKTVYIKVEDVAGNISTKTYSQTVYLDMTKPTGKIVINNGDEYTASRDVKLTLTFGDNESGVAKVRVIEGDKVYEFPSVPNSPITIPWTLDFGVKKTVSIQVVDKAGNVSDMASDSIIVDKLTINNFTLTNVINPLEFKGNSFNPMVWDFPPQPMMAGANISFALNVKAPYEPDVVTDSATYKVEIIGDNGYHKIIVGSFKDVVNSSFRETITLPIDAPKGAKVYVSSVATRKLLVSPFDVQTAYFPGPDTSTKAQIGFIDGNIEKAIKFNETK